MVRECPECGSWDTERVHTEWMGQMVEEVRICHECPTKFTVNYGNPFVEVIHTEND